MAERDTKLSEPNALSTPLSATVGPNPGDDIAIMTVMMSFQSKQYCIILCNSHHVVRTITIYRRIPTSHEHHHEPSKKAKESLCTNNVRLLQVGRR